MSTKAEELRAKLIRNFNEAPLSARRASLSTTAWAPGWRAAPPR